MINKLYLVIVFSCSLVMTSAAELIPVDDADLNQVSGRSGITLNAKIILGDESSFVFTNTSGKKIADATLDETGYLIVDKIQGELEMEGLAFDLVSGLKNSGKSALQWTLPSKIKATNLKTTGIYISSTEEVTPTTSTFLLGLELNGELSLPASTQVSLFVVD